MTALMKKIVVCATNNNYYSNDLLIGIEKHGLQGNWCGKLCFTSF